MPKVNKKIASIALVIAIAFLGTIVYIEFQSHSNPRLQIATTTSLYDTRLLEFLASCYQEHYNTSLFFIPVGTGQAIQHAKMGEADLLLVHSPSSENAFVQGDKLGVVRKIIAYNFFLIVGPAEDPAGIKDIAPIEALKKIENSGKKGMAKWISRGDSSGTHTKENSLWKKAGLSISNLREESWYIEAGSGMGATLNMANEMRAYTLSDIGTYLKYYGDRLIDLKILVGEHKDLLNVYSVMAIDPTAYPDLNFSGAVDLIKFLISDEGQEFIGNFGVTEYGQPLFHPAVRLLKENTDPVIASWIRDYAFLSYNEQKWECPPPYRAGQDNLYP